MKKFICSIVMLGLASFALAQTSKDQVVIKGTLNGDLKGYHKMYLYTRMGTDSAEIINGQYSFSFPFSEITVKMLLPEYVKKMAQVYQPFGILITEPGTYTVVSDITKGMYASSEVGGPESAVLYRQFEKDQGEAYKKINYTMADLFGKEWYRIDEKDPRYESLQNSNDSLKNVHILPLVEQFIKNHPDSYASAYVLAGSGRQVGSLKKKEQLLARLSSHVKQSDPAKKFAGYIQGLKSSGIGSKVANFVLPNPQGTDVDFKSFKGKYVLIDFWASWCVPCRKSFPHMREVYKAFKSDQFEIYSISIDQDKVAWLKAVKEENNPWLQSLDIKNVSQSGFAVTGVPSTFLIDPQGKIMAKEVGFDPNGGSEIEKKLTQLFGKKVEAKAAAEKPDKPSSLKAIPMASMGSN